MTSWKAVQFLFVVLLTQCPVDSRVVVFADDPYSDQLSQDGYVPDPEPETNLTMDQLITEAYESTQADDRVMMEPAGYHRAELDMILNEDQFKLLYGNATSEGGRAKRKAVRPLIYRWSNNVVPYEFSPYFGARDVYKVKEALQDWSDSTCIQFKPASPSDRNRIRIQNGAGCNSMLGMVGGTQAVNLQSPSCRHKGLYLHEVGHALGLVHEHQLPDRDQYIYILERNVSPGSRIWFRKYTTREVNQYKVPYEYSSVMHYGVTAFSSNGVSKTIQAKDRSKESEIGKVYLKGLSFSDIKVVNLMYECNKHCQSNPQCEEPGYLDKNCKCVCPKNVDCDKTGGTVTTGPPSATTTKESTTTTATTTGPPSETTTKESTTTTATTTGASTPTTTYMPSPPPSTTTTTTSTTTGARTTDAPGCSNNWPDSDCDRWARGGECYRNPNFMKLQCKRSCSVCGPSCEDRDRNCYYWTSYCRTNRYVKTYCKRSCRVC